MLDDLGIRVPLPAGADILSSPQRQGGSGVQASACPVVTGGSVSADKDIGI